MFHSVGNDGSTWSQNWLSVSLSHFERFCEFLKKKNYKSYFLDIWYEQQNSGERQNQKDIVLTFDDGYLDHWVYVYPILKKYGLKGTIFVNPEFIDPSEKPRHTIEDVWNKIVDQKNLKTLGFLNWSEIKTMQNSGIIDIQSHSMSHNFYFHSDKIIDFYNEQEKYPWLAWYTKPESKPFWITENQKKFIPKGYPIFEFGRALGLKRFFPSDEFVEFIISKFENFKKIEGKDIIEKLKKETEEYKILKGSIGRFETDEELDKRYRYELFDSKKILESKLGKKVDYLCWPGGGYNELSIKLSIEAGYKASTVASRDKAIIFDNTGDYKRIKRFGLGSFCQTKNGMKPFKYKNHLVYSFLGKKGNIVYKNLVRSKKGLLMIASLVD